MYGVAISLCGAAITAWVTISNLQGDRDKQAAQLVKMEQYIAKVEQRVSENEKQQNVFQLMVVQRLEEIKGDVKLVLNQGKR